MTTPTPEQPREGALIQAARERLVPKVSANKLGELAGMSGTRWRQIERGYSTPRAGQHIEVHAPPETLARMAHAVGVTPAQLRGVDRADAAEAYERLRGAGADAPPIEVHESLEDDPDWQAFELYVRDTPPELRATALRMARAAVEALQTARVHSNEVQGESKRSPS